MTGQVPGQRQSPGDVLGDIIQPLHAVRQAKITPQTRYYYFVENLFLKIDVLAIADTLEASLVLQGAWLSRL